MNDDRQNLILHLQRNPVLAADRIYHVRGRGYVYAIRTECGIEEVSLPNYVRDLNALREVWLSLSYTQQWEEHIELDDIIARNNPHLKDDDVRIAVLVANATPKQKAEAILRTIKKWEEGK